MVVDEKCKLCKRKNYEKRIFWEDSNWRAFLSSQPITRGHTILLFTEHYPGLLEALDDSTFMSELTEKLKHIAQTLYSK